MITSLTKEQELYLPEFREQWRSVGLCTDPIDADKAKKSVVALYSSAGLAEPNVMIFSSPAMCLLARAAFLKGGQLRDQLGGQLRDQLRDQLRGQLRDQLRDQLWGQLGGQLGDQLWGQLGGQLGDQLGGQLRDQLRGQLGDQLGGQLGDQLGGQLGGQLGDQLWGQLGGQLRGQLGGQLWGQDVFQQPWTIGGQDAYWISFYEFGRKIGVNYTNGNHLDAYIQYIKNCGWMFAYKESAFVSSRPSKINFDDRGLLHCETGKSVEYSDGWGCYSWHGTGIPGEWIDDKKSLTPGVALKHENLEQRRAACEILGWDLILDKLNAVTIDKDVDPQIGELVSVDLPDVGRENFLRVRCGTGRGFALPVPPEMKTALQSNAWTYGLSESEYKPEVRT